MLDTVLGFVSNNTGLIAGGGATGIVLWVLKKVPNKEIANLLISVSKIHDLRCQKLFDIFEKMVQDKCFINKDISLDYRGVPLEDEDAMQGNFWPSLDNGQIH